MENKDKLLGENTGKSISVYYNDIYNSVSFKTGKFLDFDNCSIMIQEQGSKNTALIPRNKCIRIEFGSEKQHVQAQTREHKESKNRS